MEELKSIFDTVTKTCAACGQTKTIRNFRLNEKAKVDEGSIRDIVSNVCKCCEAKPEMQLKSNRLALLREKMARYKKNAAAREHEEQRLRFNREKPIKVKKHKEWEKVNVI